MALEEYQGNYVFPIETGWDHRYCLAVCNYDLKPSGEQIGNGNLKQYMYVHACEVE